MKNTKQAGNFRVFFYPYKGGFVGVCPELGIIHRGKKMHKMKEEIFSAVSEYLETVRRLDLDDKELNKTVSTIHHAYFYWNSFKRKIKKSWDLNESWHVAEGRLQIC